MRDWDPYLRLRLPPPVEADRERLEALIGAALPDLYWRLASEHQGKGLGDNGSGSAGEDRVHFGVLLLVSPPDKVERIHSSYCVEDCFLQVQGRHPAGLLPFADDTGGNYWALDFRSDIADPAVVFIDHEKIGEEGVSRKADGFAAFLAMAGIVSA